MPQVSFRLVHNTTAFAARSDDLAAALIFPVTGLIVHLVVAIGSNTLFF
jgi:hypothetical protein